ncbi:MAG: HlyD family efflux transporter periplasmic adaptor subunit [Coriobacteriales bacterium]|jgi:multidrug resistance efflux pump|nr:HlyD family efflux transporter periplasmic adaptor subunit [Coriobacteriales bacterium]
MSKSDLIQVKTLNELSDSRLLYERKVPAFGYMIIILVALLLIGILIWSLITTKTYIVSGSGIVEGDEKSYIMSQYSGELADVKVKSGDIVEAGNELFSVKSVDLDLQNIQVDAKLDVCAVQIEKFERLRKSVLEDINLFDVSAPEDSLYYNQFEAYKSQIAQNQIDVSAYVTYGYTDAQIDAEIFKNQAKISEIYYAMLKSIEESLNNIKAEKASLIAQKEAIAKGKSEYVVQATTDGIVHLSSEYKSGMVVQAGSVLGSIAQENSGYIISAYISASDMPRVSIGDKVDVAVAGLLESTYGTISGKLTYIDSDITTLKQDAQQGASSESASYFKVKVETDAYYLVSSSGRKYNLTNGTVVGIRINYDEITYFGYLMESLGVLTR